MLVIKGLLLPYNEKENANCIEITISDLSVRYFCGCLGFCLSAASKFEPSKYFIEHSNRCDV